MARPANGISLAMAHHEGFVLELAGPATATALAGTGVSYIRDGGTCLRLIAPCYGCYCTHTHTTASAAVYSLYGTSTNQDAQV